MTHDELVALVEDLQRRVTKLERGNGTQNALAEDPWFEKFWQLYPRKAGKVDAKRAWRSLSAADMQLALTRVALYSKVWELAPPERQQYVKYPATWLRGRGWEDGEAEWKRVAWNGKAPAIQRAMVGAHPDTTPTRLPEDGSPDWVKAVYSALRSSLRPAVSDELVAHYFEWTHFTEVGEPDGWAEEIDRAFTEAKELDR